MFIFHPLIHTFAMATMVLHVGTGQKRRECGLKYVMQSLYSESTELLARSGCMRWLGRQALNATCPFEYPVVNTTQNHYYSDLLHSFPQSVGHSP